MSTETVMDKTKLALIFCLILLATSCSVEEFESFAINFNANEISFECSNNSNYIEDGEGPTHWEIDIDFDLGTGDYSRDLGGGISRIEVINRILLTPNYLRGYNEEDERIFTMARESLTVTIEEDDSQYFVSCEIVDNKLSRKF